MIKVNPSEPVNRGMLDEAVEAILEGMDKTVGQLRNEMNTRFDKVEDRLSNVEVELSHVKDEVKGLKADISTTPSRREFQDLKKRVDKHHPLL
jgi:archaellum component FlaC